MDMDSIHFNTVVGDDQVIHIPEGVALPSGPLHVTVTPCKPEPVPEDIEQLRDWLLSLASDAERDPTPLPSDMAENHDFYAHGKPRE